MRLERLYLRGVRNLAPVQIGPVRGLNVISGRNGAGKTALLEGIHLALHGRSFRDRDLCNVIGAKEACVEAAAWLCDGLPSGANRRHAVVRRERAASRTVFAVDGNGVPRLDGCGLPMSIPVTQEEIRAIRVSAERRRALVDVFLFHVNPDYAAAWRRYRSALRQRNAALRASAPCGPWEGAMSDAAQSLHDYRASHVKSIAEQLPGALEALGLDVPCEVVYRPGWGVELPLVEVLRTTRDRDQAAGHTQAGPHRADVGLRIAGPRRSMPPSAGQFKLAYIALRLGQAATLGADNVVFLADDLGAELDDDHAARAAQALNDACTQVFVTVPASDGGAAHPWRAALSECGRFHVEHGIVSPTRFASSSC